MPEIKARNNSPAWGVGPAVRIAAMASLLAAVSLHVRNSISDALRLDAQCIAENCFIFFAAMALTALYSGFHARWRLHRFFRSRVLILPAAALLLAGVYRLGMYQFGGFDEGLLVHAGTFYAQGLKPYTGFHCTMPPFYMFCIRWGIRWLGLRWSSFALIASIFAALTAVWMYRLLELCSVSRPWALAITLGVEVSTMLVIPFWWYNNSSSVVVVLLFLSVLAALQAPERWFSWASLALSLAMVITSKPNVAPACFMLFALAATRERARWAKLLLACAAAAAFVLLICYAAQMPPASVLRSYVEIARLRAAPFKLLLGMDGPEKQFQIFFLVECTLCFLVLLWRAGKRQPGSWRILLVCVMAAVTALAMASTNSEMKSCDLACMLAAAALLCLCPWETSPASPVRRIVLAGWLCLFLCTAGFFSLTHLRILNIGEGLFYEPLPTRTIRSGFFSGLEAAPHLRQVLAQSAQALSRFPAQRVFFGPRLEFEYAVFNRPVTPGMPLLWDAGNLFSPARLPRFLRNFQQADPDLLIFLSNDYTHMGMVGSYVYFTDTYRRYDGFNDLTVYVRRKDVPIRYIKLPASTPPPQQ
jgi:hypothetical protein